MRDQISKKMPSTIMRNRQQSLVGEGRGWWGTIKSYIIHGSAGYDHRDESFLLVPGKSRKDISFLFRKILILPWWGKFNSTLNLILPPLLVRNVFVTPTLCAWVGKYLYLIIKRVFGRASPVVSPTYQHIPKLWLGRDLISAVFFIFVDKAYTDHLRTLSAFPNNSCIRGIGT